MAPALVRDLMRLEAVRVEVEALPLSLAAAAFLRRKARLRSTHYSTRIEGNRLTLKQARDVVTGRKVRFHGRERDVREVENYWHALLNVEVLAERNTSIDEELIRRIHGWVMNGKRAKPTPYRTEQNAVKDGATGALVYLPPEARDVPRLMRAMVAWARRALREGVPVPVVAGLVHYQFVTIHPYDDGNGRTARLLATLVLQSGGYGLKGFYSMEEHHARDLEGYYRALVTHPHHNYFEGRAEADLTPWVGYFIGTVKSVFDQARAEAFRMLEKKGSNRREEPKGLDHRGRTVWSHLREKGRAGSNELARLLGISERMMRLILNEWIEAGWIEPTSKARKGRAYRLTH
jgi:Fic family protein